MNKDLVKAIRLSMVFGFIGAIVIPFAFEVFANLGAIFGWILVLTFTIIASVKFSSLKLRNSAIGFITMLVFMFGLGIIGYMVIHPAIKSLLINSSEYFYTAPKDTFLFFLKAVLMQLIIPIVCFTKRGIIFALKKIRANGEATRKYIDNAFEDEIK